MVIMNMTLTLLRAQHVLIMIRDHSQKYQANQKIRGPSTSMLAQHVYYSTTLHPNMFPYPIFFPPSTLFLLVIYPSPWLMCLLEMAAHSCSCSANQLMLI